MLTRQKLFLRLLLALSALTLGVLFYVDVYGDDDVVGDITRRGLQIDEGFVPHASSGGLPDGTYHYPDGSVVHVVREEDEDHFIAKEERTRKLDQVEDNFIVELNLSPGVDPHVACFELAESIGGEVGYVLIGLFTGCEIMPSEITGMSDTDMEASLTTASVVGAIMRNGPIEAYSIGTGSDPIWNLDRIDQCSLPLDGVSFKEDASNVKVFIMDSGIRADHEEFVGMINPNDACHFSYPFRTGYAPTPPLVDVNGHGTHVAGTVCGHKYGVSSNCQICSVKVLKSDLRGDLTAWLAGLNHIDAYCKANPGTRCVVNMSLGSPTYSVLGFNQQIERAIAAGLVIVVSAGNHNNDACNYSPASATSAITVGATTIHDGRWTGLLKSSNFGSCVDVWAPGARIKSADFLTVNEYSLMNGTSMAAPHVTGIAAAILSRNPAFTPQDVVSVIIASSSTLSTPTLAGAASLAGQKFITTSCTSCASSATLPAHCTNPPTSLPTSTPTFTPTSKPTQQCLNIGTRLTSYGQTCACSTLRTVCADTSGRCCSGFCRITSRGVSVCREAPSRVRPR